MNNKAKKSRAVDYYCTAIFILRLAGRSKKNGKGFNVIFSSLNLSINMLKFVQMTLIKIMNTTVKQFCFGKMFFNFIENPLDSSITVK